MTLNARTAATLCMSQSRPLRMKTAAHQNVVTASILILICAYRRVRLVQQALVDQRVQPVQPVKTGRLAQEDLLGLQDQQAEQVQQENQALQAQQDLLVQMAQQVQQENPALLESRVPPERQDLPDRPEVSAQWDL